MTDESNTKLLMAYRAVCVAQMTSVAELLEDVILELMDGEKLDMVTIGATDEIRPSLANKTMTVTTVDAVRDWDDDE